MDLFWIIHPYSLGLLYLSWPNIAYTRHENSSHFDSDAYARRKYPLFLLSRPRETRKVLSRQDELC